MALNMVTIHGLLRHPDNVTAQKGKAIFTPGTGTLVDSADGTVLAGSIAVPIADDGTFTPVLPATDNTGTQPLPNTWNWTVRFELYDDTIAPFSFALPSSPSSINFASLVRVLPAAGTYLVIPGPKGDKGDDGGAGEGALIATNNLSELTDLAAARTHLGLGTAATQASTAFDTAGAASSAQATANTYTDGKITAEVTRANAAYDTSGSASAAQTAAATDATAKVAAEAIRANATYDPTGAASAAQTAAAADATAKVATEVTRANAAYLAKTSDLADLHDATIARSNLGLGSAAVQSSSAFDAAGTAAADLVTAKAYADTGDAATLVSAKAYTDAHSGGGGGSSIVTRSVRVTDDNLSGLPSAASWTVAQTSGGTKLQCSIPAAAGDRIKVHAGFMRSGSHFLDWVLLDNTGAISVYAGTVTSSPLPEGDPDLYPSLSFGFMEMVEMFTVGAGHILSGNVTVGLAHQGTGAGIVYAHTSYPFRLRLENIGPEPA